MSKQLLKSTAITSGMTFISRILGLVREMVTAYYFGASAGYDAFVIAFKIPNFMRRLFAEGAFSQAFVPILSEYKTKTSHEEVQHFINRVSGSLTLVLVAVTLVGLIAAPLFVMLFAPGFATTDYGVRLDLATDMLRITFPYLLLISLTAFAGGILNSSGRFAAAAFTPVFLNVAMIAAVFALSPFLESPVMSLAWGVLIGGIIQLLFQIPFLKKINCVPRFELNWHDPGVKRILLLMVPALLGVSINQLNLMLSSIFASFLPVGSVSWMYYAERLMEFPLGGVGVALATVVLPRLSRHHTKSEDGDFSGTLDWGIRWVMLVGLPAALGLALLAGPLLVTLFQSGKFTEHDVLYSKPCLVAYSLGVMGFMLVKILASAYYAKQDIKTPVRIAMVVVIANAIFSAAFVVPLAHVGLALATSLAALLNASLLGYGLLKRKAFQFQPGWQAFMLKLLAALCTMAGIIYYFCPELEVWFNAPVMKRVLMLASIILGSGVSYFAVLWLTGLRIHHMLARVAEAE